MRIGFDVDGCLANFNVGYIKLHIDITGKILFRLDDDVDPPVWNYPAYRGYTKEETSTVWQHIKESSDFWYNLPLYEKNCRALATFSLRNSEHDLYFITSRVGGTAKGQTEDWFRQQAIVYTPTVLIVGTGQKGNIARALQLDTYIDDYYDNCEDVVRTSPQTRCYVLDKRYNRRDGLNQLSALEARRVKTLDEFLRREGLIG